jgi:hypothetical protein
LLLPTWQFGLKNNNNKRKNKKCKQTIVITNLAVWDCVKAVDLADLLPLAGVDGSQDEGKHDQGGKQGFHLLV